MTADLTAQIVRLEFQMFQAVSNRGGRASCQDDFSVFEIMRSSQFSAWSRELRENYWEDLKDAAAARRNLPAEKYAWMLAATHPDEFALVKQDLPLLPEEQTNAIEEIMPLQMGMAAALYHDFPLTCAASRPLFPDAQRPEITPGATYLRGELCTYSLRTLTTYLSYLQRLRQNGGNLPKKILEHTVRRYGYPSLAARENYLWKTVQK